jgi:rod shape-determining protein MreD
MRPSVWRKLDLLARQSVPCALTFAMLLIGIVPLHIPQFQMVAPSLPLIAVFYWTLYRPDLMPAFAAFFIGLLHDILVGLPLGVSAGVFVCVHAAVNTQRRFFIGKSFSVVWLGFAVVASTALTLFWLITCAYYGALVAPSALVFQTLTTLGCFPIVCWVLLRCQLSLLNHA